MTCCISAAGLGQGSAAGAGPPGMIATDRIAPAIATPVLADADTTNVGRILCVIELLRPSVMRGLDADFDAARKEKPTPRTDDDQRRRLR
jgi:hypothetical protein